MDDNQYIELLRLLQQILSMLDDLQKKINYIYSKSTHWK